MCSCHKKSGDSNMCLMFESPKFKQLKILQNEKVMLWSLDYHLRNKVLWNVQGWVYSFAFRSTETGFETFVNFITAKIVFWYLKKNGTKM